MCKQNSNRPPARRTKATTWLIATAVLVALEAIPQTPATPSVGKFRTCRARPDCSAPPVCNRSVETRSCFRTAFGIQINDPVCEAQKAANHSLMEASYQACMASRSLWIEECNATAKQADLCFNIRNQEIQNCDTEEFRRVGRTIPKGSRSSVPVGVQVEFVGFGTAKVSHFVVSEAQRLVPKKGLIREELERQGWVVVEGSAVTEHVVIFRNRIPKGRDLCSWADVVAGIEIVESLGTDGYCQVIKSQPDYMKLAVQQRGDELRTAAHLSCVARK